MRSVHIVLALIGFVAAGLGCSHQPSEAEVKKGQEQMQKLETDLSKDLPAKL